MSKEVSVTEARAVLKDLEKVRSKARNRILADFSAIPLMLWGLGWAFCHLNGCLYLVRGSGLFGIHPDVAAKLVFLVGVPITFTYVLLRLRFARPVRGEDFWLVRYRAPLLFMVWCLFYECTSDLHGFDYGMQKNAYDSMYWMLLFIVYGFWLANGLYLSIGMLGADRLLHFATALSSTAGRGCRGHVVWYRTLSNDQGTLRKNDGAGLHGDMGRRRIGA